MGNAASWDADSEGCSSGKVGKEVEIGKAVGIRAQVEGCYVHAMSGGERLGGEKTVGHHKLLLLLGSGGSVGRGRC